MELNKLLGQKEFVFLDGGMGTMLQSSGLEAGEIPELLNLTSPELIESIHLKYIDAGSDIFYANTFGANRYKLEKSGRTVAEIVGAAVKIANSAKSHADRQAYCALDIGPIGQMMEPNGTMLFDEAYDIFKEMIEAGREADVIVIETMTDLLEAKAALLAAKENSDLPVIVTMTFEENMRTFTGCCIESMAMTMAGLGADAIGINCSLGPRELFPAVEKLCSCTNLPVVIKPNAGLPDPVTNEYNVMPDEFAELLTNMIPLGIKIIGGCCGTSPDYIRATVKAFEGRKCEAVKKTLPSAVCSASNAVIIDCPRIIGERINPTGKKRFKQALQEHDLDYICNQAIEQIDAGAEILDVNVGLPGIDEREMMMSAVRAVQGICDTPLQIDSSIPEVLDSALRIYSGKPIVNSVNGEEKSLSTILPLVAKYGAAVVGLCLDENGIPKTVEGRVAIAEKICKRADALGIPRSDICIDCLTLTCSAEQEAAMQTIEALRICKEKLGVRTVLGVSNISFGLPQREIVNRTFLTMALTKGLDLPIMNPNIASMTSAVRAYRLLANIDKNAKEFVENYGADPAAAAAPVVKQEEMTLGYAMSHGLKNDAAQITAKLLETMDSMDIVNNILIPELDKTGAEFEKGKIFLPQLIMTAGVAQSCFEVIKQSVLSSGGGGVSKGKIVLCTVKGDVHDIGKNIVKVMLENYGFTVIDLGKDVDPQLVVDAAIEHDVKLVGLSALMTTTLKGMEDTINLLRQHHECKIMVGGAVLTPDYAEQIGADYYAKDAKQSCDIAKEVYGDE
ncbi:5-methyltetrahydrofolate--homocysteine methyltransferase [Ruminococcus sp. YE71]|uniref:homocysteine S-methyltransferase family protein n=1 Tax=unclassified Ruminococcus TaxID=2608920 RepID=UPI000888A410|nr:MULTISPECIES: homocysteine S-methyltransferase family protein [unclassified Ruminococcus]SDA24253.1 5-methyltetrahydrofolate--homocysteine methyltransferase [Ruminococcus sp. YE78]SFW41699.1 5-methyltetrahydrofolate--homocysteine methyltransferase [Ruminococcus sp. YE71]